MLQQTFATKYYKNNVVTNFCNKMLLQIIWNKKVQKQCIHKLLHKQFCYKILQSLVATKLYKRKNYNKTWKTLSCKINIATKYCHDILQKLCFYKTLQNLHQYLCLKSLLILFKFVRLVFIGSATAAVQATTVASIYAVDVATRPKPKKNLRDANASTLAAVTWNARPVERLSPLTSAIKIPFIPVITVRREDKKVASINYDSDFDTIVLTTLGEPPRHYLLNEIL